MEEDLSLQVTRDFQKFTDRILAKKGALIFISVLFYVIAWNRGIPLLYAMFSLVAATLVVSFVAPRLSLKSIHVDRRVGHLVTFEGDSVDVTVSVENRGWRNRYMIEIVDFNPAAGPGLRKPMTFLARIPGRARKEYGFSFVCYKRGEYTIGPLTLRSSYPLGISSAERPVAETSLSILVLPQLFEIAHLSLIFPNSSLQTGVEALAKTGGSDEFFGTREYRRGDSLRHIHWPLSAKHGVLIVKEFEIRGSTQVSVILDLMKGFNVGEEKEATLEYVAKIAGSMAKYALERSHSFQVIGYGDKSSLASCARGVSHLGAVLESLARITDDGETPYYDAIVQASPMLNEGSTVILFFSTATEGDDIARLLYAVRLLMVKRINIISVFLDTPGFQNPKKATHYPEDHMLLQELTGLGKPCYVVHKGDDLVRVFEQ
jgi:uncharacterized protein (DUF58 family)